VACHGLHEKKTSKIEIKEANGKGGLKERGTRGGRKADRKGVEKKGESENLSGI